MDELDEPTQDLGIAVGEDPVAEVEDVARVAVVAGEDVAGTALQGNLDPAIVLAPWPVVEAEVRDVLARNDGHPGHIFNLGHGVQPEVDPAILEQVVELVHREGRVRPLAPGTPAAGTREP